MIDRQRLFSFFAQEYDVTLLESEMQEIEGFFDELSKQRIAELEAEPANWEKAYYKEVERFLDHDARINELEAEVERLKKENKHQTKGAHTMSIRKRAEQILTLKAEEASTKKENLIKEQNEMCRKLILSFEMRFEHLLKELRDEGIFYHAFLNVSTHPNSGGGIMFELAESPAHEASTRSESIYIEPYEVARMKFMASREIQWRPGDDFIWGDWDDGFLITKIYTELITVRDKAVGETLEKTDTGEVGVSHERFANKYLVFKNDGTPLDRNAQPFVMVVNSHDIVHAQASCIGMLAYADFIDKYKPMFAADIRDMVLSSGLPNIDDRG